MKTIEELKDINDERLLVYFKSERKRFYNCGWICGCCGEYYWDLYPNDPAEKKRKERHDAQLAYLNMIRSELNRRGHVVKDRRKRIYIGDEKHSDDNLHRHNHKDNHSRDIRARRVGVEVLRKKDMVFGVH